MKKFITVSIISLAAALSTNALAQQSNDVIIVTATKRAQSLQDVPVAITAVSAEQIERKGVKDIRDITRLAPSFVTSNSQSASSTVFRIRGVGTTGNNAGLESAVGVFMDGVYLSRPNIALSDLVDVEQVEVLRGPQGTLFGRNTSAGALTIRTKKPNMDEFEAFTNVTAGNYNLKNIQAGFSVPIPEANAGFRLSGTARQQDAYITSTSGAESNNKDRFAVKAQLLVEPTDALSFRVIADYSKVDEQCCDAILIRETPIAAAYPLAGIPAGGGIAALGDDALENRVSNAEQFDNPFSQTGISAELNWDLGFGELTYIPAYRTFEAVTDQQNDFVNLDALSSRTTNDNKSMSHELRLQGSGWDDRVDWMVGAYYSEEDIVSRQRLELGADYQAYAGTILLAGGIRNFGGNPLLFLAQGRSAEGNFADNEYSQDSESFSIFTHNIFSVTDKLDLTLGARYVDESKDGAYNQLDANSPACLGVLTNPIFGNPQVAPLRDSAIALTCFPFSTQANIPGSPITPVTFADTFKDDELVYTAKLGYKVSDNLNAYAGFTHGFKSGGFNLDSTAAIGGADPRFASEKIDNFEAGIKGSLADGRLKANLAVFHQNITDLQVLEFTGIQFTTYNAPKGKSSGVELDTEFYLTDDLTISASGAYTNARYPDDCDAGLTGVPASVAARVANLCGNKFTNAPEFTAVFGGTYESDILGNGWGLLLDANARYSSDRRTSTQALDLASGNPLFGDIQPSNIIANGRVGFTSPSEKWAFEVWGNNIFDERTKSVTFNIPLRGRGDSAARGVFIAEPATYGATLRWKY